MNELIKPAPTGRGTYAELGKDANFGDVTVNDITIKGDLEYEYPEVPYSPAFLLPLRSDLLPAAGSSSVTFTRTTKASWTDYDGVLRWSPSNTPRFTGVRWDGGAIRETTTDGRLIPDDMSYIGTILAVGDSQGYCASCFPHRVESVLKGATVINDCVSGQTLATIAANIITTLETYSPDTVIIEGGVNDIASGTGSSAMLGYAETIISACIQYGAEPILMEVSPFGAFVDFEAGWQDVLDEYNAGLNSLSEIYGYKIVKLYQIFEDPASAGDANSNYVVGDFLHWSNAGQRLVTSEIINVLNPRYLKGMLFETAQYNQAIYSQDLTNAAWENSNTSDTGNSAAAPDLTITADTVTATAANGTLLQTYDSPASDHFCFSVWLKRKTGTGKIYITIDGGTTLTAVNVGDTWRRFWVTNEVEDPIFGVQIVTNTDAVYAWGAQVESGTYPTSYFPTEATEEQRGGDVAYFPSTGLTIAENSRVATIDPLWTMRDLADISSTQKVYIADATTASVEFWRTTGGTLALYKYTSVPAIQYLFYQDDSIGFIDEQPTVFIAKVGYTTSDSDNMIYLYDDGRSNSSTEITDFGSGYGTNIYIGCKSSGVEQLNGHIKNFIIYNKVLSAEQMHEVTSW